MPLPSISKKELHFPPKCSLSVWGKNVCFLLRVSFLLRGVAGGSSSNSRTFKRKYLVRLGTMRRDLSLTGNTLTKELRKEQSTNFTVGSSAALLSPPFSSLFLLSRPLPFCFLLPKRAFQACDFPQLRKRPSRWENRAFSLSLISKISFSARD